MMEDQCLNDSEDIEVNRLKCGACGFSTNRISDLHYHQQVHGIGGSYYFCHLSKTAYPRFDLISFGSQTDPLDFALAQILDSSNANLSLINGGNTYLSYDTIQGENEQTLGDINQPGKAYSLRHDEKNGRKSDSKVGPINSCQKNGKHTKRSTDKKAVKGKLSESSDQAKIESDSENKTHGVLSMDLKESSCYPDGHLRQDSFIDTPSTDTGCVDNVSDTNSQALALGPEPPTSHIVNDHSYEHLHLYDQDVVKQTRLHACVFCEDVTYRRKLSLLLHLKKCHNNELPFKCDECKKYLVSMTDAERHVQLHKRGQYECQVCLKKLSSELSLVEHITAHTGEKPFQCKLCPNRYRKKHSLDIHATCHSDKKSHVCEFCGKAFSSRVKVSSHIWSCVKNVECSICKKMFSGQCKLKVHMRKHTKERPYVCEVCGCAFSYGSGLVRHKKFRHTKQKDHKCSNCDMRFVTKQSLDRHERVHTSVKGYACSVCGKSFRADWTLKVHNRIHTGEMPYACDFCGKRYKINKTRKAHQSSCPMKKQDSS